MTSELYQCNVRKEEQIPKNANTNRRMKLTDVIFRRLFQMERELYDEFIGLVLMVVEFDNYMNLWI